MSSRISASSSTIRMSAAMSCFLDCLSWYCLHFGGQRHEAQRNSGAAPAIKLSRRVLEQNAPVVLFHDALDDGEAEAGALLARGHVRLRQAMTVLARQADAVVSNADERLIGIDARFDQDATLVTRLGVLARLDRLARILDEIGHRLSNKPPIEREHRVRLGELDGDIEIAGAYPLKHRCLLHHRDQVLRLERRGRHARKGRELVDHASDIADLANDRIGALLEDLLVGG